MLPRGRYKPPIMNDKHIVNYMPDISGDPNDIFHDLKVAAIAKGGIPVDTRKMTLLEDPSMEHRRSILEQKGLLYKAAQGTAGVTALVYGAEVFKKLDPLVHGSEYATSLATIGATWLACTLGLKGLHKAKSKINVWRLERSMHLAGKDIKAGKAPANLDTAEESAKMLWPVICAGATTAGIHIATVAHASIYGLAKQSFPQELVQPGGFLTSLQKVAALGTEILTGGMTHSGVSLTAYAVGGAAVGLATGLRLTKYSRINGILQEARSKTRHLLPQDKGGNIGVTGGMNAPDPENMQEVPEKRQTISFASPRPLDMANAIDITKDFKQRAGQNVNQKTKKDPKKEEATKPKKVAEATKKKEDPQEQFGL